MNTQDVVTLCRDAMEY